MVRKEDVISAYAIRNNIPVNRVRCCFRSINLTNDDCWRGEVGIMQYEKPEFSSFEVFNLNPTKDLAYIINIFCNKSVDYVNFGSLRGSRVGSFANWGNFFTSRLFITEVRPLFDFVAIINYYHLSIMPDLS